jgi:release factor glutamine methyltransferase
LPELVAVRMRDALASATAELARARCDTPRLDAELLLAEVLGVGRERLVLDAASAVETAALERFHGLIARRAAREPVAYILGRKDFRWITVAVDRRVLIPRPETELLVEVGLTLPDGATVLDVGTGSGAVALALKHERPDLRVSAVDSSGPALALARENAHHLAPDVHFAHSDLIPGGRERFYAIVANLPYVPDGTVLPPEVAEYEPAAALFGGADGLDVIRRLLTMIDPGVELVALEVGFDQAAAVSALVQRAGFVRVERLRDLAGHERVVVGRRSATRRR